MVTSDTNVGQRLEKIDAFIGLRTIANDITKTPDLIILPRVGKDSLESTQIAVNVGENDIAHSRPHCEQDRDSCPNVTIESLALPRETWLL